MARSRPLPSAGKANGSISRTTWCAAPTAASFSPTLGCAFQQSCARSDFPAYFASIRRAHVHLATDECEYPNGLAFSPDESVLYVAISRLDERCFQEAERGEVCTHRRIRAFDVAPDGTLSNNRVFCDMSSADPGVPDGMKVDTKGRVFCVGSGGIWVIAPSGEVIGILRMPEVVRNLAFGGPDFRTLYLTTRGSLAKLEVKTSGDWRIQLAGKRVVTYVAGLCSCVNLTSISSLEFCPLDCFLWDRSATFVADQTQHWLLHRDFLSGGSSRWMAAPTLRAHVRVTPEYP